eukprot:SAG11_NODE_221_length_12151_cov_5.633173_7_plen_207_part_00
MDISYSEGLCSSSSYLTVDCSQRHRKRSFAAQPAIAQKRSRAQKIVQSSAAASFEEPTVPIALTLQGCIAAANARMLHWDEVSTLVCALESGVLQLPTRPLTGATSWTLYCETTKSPPRRRTGNSGLVPEKWRNSGGLKGASQSPTEDGSVPFRRRYGEVLICASVDTPEQRLRMYEYSRVKGEKKLDDGEGLRLFHVTCDKRKKM